MSATVCHMVTKGIRACAGSSKSEGHSQAAQGRERTACSSQILGTNPAQLVTGTWPCTKHVVAALVALNALKVKDQEVVITEGPSIGCGHLRASGIGHIT